jgi:hypothetical protein
LSARRVRLLERLRALLDGPGRASTLSRSTTPEVSLVKRLLLLVVLSTTPALAADPCPAKERRCGTACYDPVRMKCQSGVVCALGEEVCGGQCFDPVRMKCLKGVVCAKGEELCKGECFNPSVTTCK